MLQLVLRSILILVSLAATVRAADPLPQAFSCGKEGPAGGLGAGTDLTRHVIDTTRFPEAVCNDGTPAIFYYGAATRPEDENKWIIFLQGGGSCVDGQSCAERWCSIDTAYGLHKMSSSQSKPQIRGAGFLSPDPENRFGSWNRVLIYYCSSDTWAGTSTRTVSAALNGAASREYVIHFRGSRIVDSVLDTLRNATPAGRRRVARHDASNATSPWPDLDSATAVMFAGSSAGGAGVRNNLDRAGARLRATNPDVVFRGVIDAIYFPLSENRDFTKSTFCAADVRGCSYEGFTRGRWDSVQVELYDSRGDASCVDWHTANAPGTEWRCGDGEHVNLHHLTTPFFLRQDLLDENIAADYVEAGFGTPSDYARAIESEMRNLPVPEEARGAVPGQFVPQCTDHESFTTNQPVFRVRLDGVSWHDAVWNWATGAQPQQLIRNFTGTVARAPECPPPN